MLPSQGFVQALTNLRLPEVKTQSLICWLIKTIFSLYDLIF